MKDNVKKIGEIIKNTRNKKNLTQKELADLLNTKQSVIARMESGDQNITISELARVEKALNEKIIKISKNDTIDFEIEGGHKLKGEIEINTSKNGAVNMLCASLLNKGETILHDIPKIEEVYRYLELMESIGVKTKWIGEKSLSIKTKKIDISKIDRNVSNKIRSFTFVGALIHHDKNFEYPNFGGCKMGARTIAAHKYGLESFGVKIKTKENFYEISSQKLKPAEITMYESSDTGAINLIIAAALIPGISIIKMAPPNYQVQDVCFLIEKMGVKIEGIGTSTLTIHGQKEINKNIEYYNSEDPIEAMFFIAAAIVTKSNLKIKRASVCFLDLEIEKLKRMGQKFKISKTYLAKNEKTKLVDIDIIPSKLTALPDKIHTQPFPGINNDNLPFFVPIALVSKGQTLIHDWTWENRAIYFTELNRLGADIKLLDPHRVLVNGGNELSGNQIVCPPALRPSAIILISMLAARGQSKLYNIYSIKRGYESIAERLNSLGAKIKVIKNP